MKEIFFSNIPAGIAVIGLCLYFFGMAIVFGVMGINEFGSSKRKSEAR